jgi:hypothetical protein
VGRTQKNTKTVKHASPPAPTEAQQEAFFAELSELLDRIDTATTHYQVLGLDRLAATGEVKIAYLRIVAFLNPSYFDLGLALPATLIPRIDEAFERVSQAYSVLVSFNRRLEYDDTLIRQMTEGLSSGEVSSEGNRAELGSLLAAEPLLAEPDVLEDNGAEEFPSGLNRRRSERFKLTIPVRVTGYDSRFGRWNELTFTVDVSKTGALVKMRRQVKQGMVVNLLLPLPATLREHNYAGSTYGVYALVRRVEALKGGLRTVGLEFLDEQPPEGYLEKPWGSFEVGSWNGVERRREAREERSEAVWVEYFTKSMECLGRQIARTENISRGGMRIVQLKPAPAEFEVLRISSPNRQLQRFGVVCNRFVGKDQFERLCIRIVADEWPL